MESNLTPVLVGIDVAACIRAGINAPQRHTVVDIDVSTLSPEARDYLAKSSARLNASDMVAGYREGMPYIQNVAGVDAQAAVGALNRQIEERKLQAQRERDDRERRTAKTRATFLAYTDEDLVEEYRTGIAYDAPGYRVRTPYAGMGDVSIQEMAKTDAVVAEKLARGEQMARERRESAEQERKQRQREQEQREAAEKEAKEAAMRRRAEQLAAWVKKHGTDSQKKRFQRGVLAEDEILDGIRNATFAPLNDLPRYQRMTREEVAQALAPDQDDESNVRFTTREMETWTEADMAVVERIEKALPGATIEATEHVGYMDYARGPSDPEFRRYSAKVTVQVGELTLSREYALPDEVEDDES